MCSIRILDKPTARYQAHARGFKQTQAVELVRFVAVLRRSLGVLGSVVDRGERFVGVEYTRKQTPASLWSHYFLPNSRIGMKLKSLRNPRRNIPDLMDVVMCCYLDLDEVHWLFLQAILVCSAKTNPCTLSSLFTPKLKVFLSPPQ